MTRGRSSRKSDQRGIEAIFSSSKKPRLSRVILGGLALLTGISLIVVSVIMIQYPHLWGRSLAESYTSLGFASIGVFALTCGVGIIISGYRLSHSLSSGTPFDDNTSGVLLTTDEAGDNATFSSSRSSSPNLKLALTVFLQGCILLSLYTGLVDEYQSSPTMQAWVRSSFDNARYLLNWGALLLSSFLLGAVFVYSLVNRDLVQLSE